MKSLELTAASSESKTTSASLVKRFMVAVFTVLVLVAMRDRCSAANSTYTVTKVDATKGGDFTIQYAVDGKQKEADISVEQGDGRDEIASKIQKAIGNGATVKGNKVTFGGSAGSGAHLITNDFVTLTTNDDTFDSCGGKEACPSAGMMFFAPNPDNGQDKLLVDTLVTAGFANGLNPVSFDATAGESIYDLTLALNSELDDGGYATALLDSTHIEVFADGSMDPTEMDLTLSANGPVGDQGILYGIDTPAPETQSLILLGSGLLCAGGALRKRLLHRIP